MSYKVTKGMIEEAKRGLEWRREFGRGGQKEGVARGRDISNGKNLSLDTVIRMYSFFARHEKNKKALGYRPGEPGFPSAGRIAWALWGGDPGRTWAEAILKREGRLSEVRNLLQEELHIGHNTNMTIAEQFDSLGASPGYRVVLEEAALRVEERNLVAPEMMVMGWPFRFVSVGKVFGGHTAPVEAGGEAPYQRGKDITEQDLDDALAIFHKYGYPINVDREHRMDEPRGVVLDMWKTLDDEGNPSLACIPAYGAELADYVYKCDGTLFSSPAIEWASDNGWFVDQATGENMGKFRINGLAVCVRPGQAPRKLDRVRLTDASDSEVFVLTAKGEQVPKENFTNILDNAISIGDDSDINTQDHSESYTGDELMDEEKLMALLEEMLAEKFAILADHLMKIEEKVAGKMEDDSEEEMAEDGDAADAEGEAGAEEDKMSALEAELKTLKEEKFTREAKAAVVALGLPKHKHSTAMAAWRAEFVDNKSELLGFKPFSDVFDKNTNVNLSGDARGYAAGSTPETLHEAAEMIAKSENLSYTPALTLAMERYPSLVKAGN